MSLTPWRRGGLPGPFQQLQREMDHLMQRFFDESESTAGRTGVVTWAPRVDVEEEDNQFVIKADLPGVDSKDIEVTMVENTLVLHGQKKEEREEKSKNFRRVERFEGQFYREIPLPRGIDAEKIQARSTNGVLTITVPKQAQAQPKKISVQPE